MFDTYRETHDLLVDYAEALRDGNVPTFLKSLSKFEGQHVLPIPHFWHAAEVVRLLNTIAFADGITHPSLDLFIIRVDAKIASRIKKAGKPARTRGKRTIGGQAPRA